MILTPFNRAAKPALLVIDSQKQFCDPVWDRGNASTVATARHIGRLLPDFRRAGLPVYAIYYARSLCAKPEYLDYYGFEPAPGDTILIKKSNSAFKTGATAETLRLAGHRQLLICGFNYSACVKDTAIDAAHAGYQVTVLRDMCANDEWAHQSQDWATPKMTEAGVTVAHATWLLPRIAQTIRAGQKPALIRI